MIKKLFRQMLLTQILSAMTVTLCMLIDSIMIGRFLGIESMSAYGYSTPVLLVFAAVGSMISAGVQVMCGRTMGSGDKEGTNACFTVSVALTAIFSIVGMAAVLIFTDPLCTLLGAGENTPDNTVFALTRDYLRGFIIGAPAFMAAQIMVPYMQMSGSRTRLVVAVIAMTLGDVLFDILNVFVIRQGTFGMGLASSLSYYIAFVIGVIYFFKKECIFKFKLALFKFRTCVRLMKDGVPTLVNQVSLVLLTLLLNQLLTNLGGSTAVAAYSVISTVGNICYSFSSGVAAVALTLSSIFYADEDKPALTELVRVMLKNAVLICAVVTAVIVLAAKPLVMLFIQDMSAVDMAITGLRLFVLSLVPCALNTTLKNYYQGVERVGLTLTISVMQNFALTALGAFVISRFAGVTGVWLGFLTGEGLTFIFICIYVFVKRGSRRFGVQSFSLIPEDFGAADDCCLDVSVTAAEDVVTVSKQASDFCKEKGLAKRTGSLMALAVEEMSNNIIEYGFADGREHSIDIRIVVSEGETILRIRDNCIGFDPVKYLELHQGDDPVAHIGIKMVMKLVKDANYVNSLGLNNLRLTL